MLNVESYKPEKEVARRNSRGFSESKQKITKEDEPQKKSFNIKDDPKIIIRAFFYTTVTAGLIGLIVFSSYKIIRWQAESDITNEQIQTISNNTEITTIESNKKNDADHILIEENQNQPDASDPYWNYITIPLINVDLTASKATNQDTVGWINVPGTSINYPFVQTKDNSYYLYHSFNKAWSDAGWVFLDYRNSNKLDQKNQIIYAHGRVDGSMFGSLVNVLSEEWQNNTDNHIVKISTETQSSLWQVFSTYKLKTTNDYLTVDFNNDTHFIEFINMIKKRSAYDFKTTVNENDKILTLSTCVGFTERAVLHAKLIKVIEK